MRSHVESSLFGARSRGVMASILLIIMLCGVWTELQARPLRGSIQLSVILCKSSDAGTPNHDMAYYQDLVLNSGTGEILSIGV